MPSMPDVELETRGHVNIVRHHESTADDVCMWSLDGVCPARLRNAILILIRLAQPIELLVRPELVKVVGVAPTELQEMGGGSQSQPTTQPLSCRISCANSSCVFLETFFTINLYVSLIFIHISPIQFIS